MAVLITPRELISFAFDGNSRKYYLPTINGNQLLILREALGKNIRGNTTPPTKQNPTFLRRLRLGRRPGDSLSKIVGLNLLKTFLVAPVAITLGSMANTRFCVPHLNEEMCRIKFN
ncbi:hypothetical protein M1413_04005 [Patescibacteria group bacterium]|nr:hypothetical protein [Patescibacteria group bacterium]MCL5114867.1 hypothetical protein [Patescibacteria group bacterium]